MKKKLIAFDLDDTLAVTKSPITPRMSGLLKELLEHYDVCVISGGKFEIFLENVVKPLDASGKQLTHLHLMPTCGTRYYRYDATAGDWELQYANDLTDDQKKAIIATLEEVAKEIGIWVENPKGEIIEDRLSQITHSALGQLAAPEEKYAWAKAYEDVRPVFRDKVAEKLPDLEVRMGGTTSLDITLPGVDKAYGMEKLMTALDIPKEAILFMGDKLQEGGNDYPVKALGIDCIAVDGWETTAYAIEGILAVS